jgi:hypothetical protein
MQKPQFSGNLQHNIPSLKEIITFLDIYVNNKNYVSGIKSALFY